eukprot:149936-Pelagomonas_calceolata.AAC.10
MDRGFQKKKQWSGTLFLDSLLTLQCTVLAKGSMAYFGPCDMLVQFFEQRLSRWVRPVQYLSTKIHRQVCLVQYTPASLYRRACLVQSPSTPIG